MLKKIDDKLIFKIDIIEDEPRINVQDEIAIADFKLQNNIVSIVDLVIRDNPDLTEEEAMLQLQENKKVNEKYLTLMNNINNGKENKTGGNSAGNNTAGQN